MVPHKRFSDKNRDGASAFHAMGVTFSICFLFRFDLSAVGSGCSLAKIPSLNIWTVWLLTLNASVATCERNLTSIDLGTR